MKSKTNPFPGDKSSVKNKKHGENGENNIIRYTNLPDGGIYNSGSESEVFLGPLDDLTWLNRLSQALTPSAKTFYLTPELAFDQQTTQVFQFASVTFNDSEFTRKLPPL